MKTCSRCGRKQSETNYPKYPNGTPRTICRDCIAIYFRDYYQKNKAKKKAQHDAYYLENKRSIQVKRRIWYEKNKAEIYEYNKQYEQKYPERVKEYSLKAVHRRRAKKHKNGIYQITKKELFQIRNSNCLYCGSKEQITIDHVIPISRGGTHSIGNLVPACLKCNSSKHNKTIMEWKKLQYDVKRGKR